MSGLEFRNLLEAGDVEGCRRFWRKHAPNMPQPESSQAAEIVMHIARTEAASVKFECRAWSHAWLMERGLPSRLPDQLKPAAQRIYPVKAVAVGISVQFKSPWLKDAGIAVRTAMESAVLEAHADGRLEDSEFVKGRMMHARENEMAKLFGKGARCL